MKKKYVFITNSTKPSLEVFYSSEGNFINTVNKPCIETAITLGYDVYLGVNRAYPEKIVCPDYPIKFYNSNTFRSLFNIKDNWKAYKNLSAVLKTGDVEVIHCNSPIGGMIGRICGRKYHVPIIIYTVHGFHFFKGAPLFNNTILKWSENIMARWTDAIITLNNEDFVAAKKMKLKRNGKVFFIHGVGIDVKKYQNCICDVENKRKELGLKVNDFVCIATGDLVVGKNYETAIEAIGKCKNQKIHYIICGDGPNKGNLLELTKKLGLQKQIHFLGYRNDINELLHISDCFLFTSVREGLSRSLMEAMASGLPCIVSDIRGNRDLIKDGAGGFLCNIKDKINIGEKINLLVENKKMRSEFGEVNLITMRKYDIDIVKKEIEDIYHNLINDGK